MLVLLIDADGVVIKKHEYLSTRLAEYLDIPVERTLRFFTQGDYDLCATGQADIRVVILPYLEDWGWKGTLDQFFKFWHEGEAELDYELLEYLRDLQQTGVLVYLVTDQEQERWQYLSTVVGLEQWFDRAFVSYLMGFKKDSPEFFQYMKEILNFKSADYVYFDDDAKNGEVAEKEGIEFHLYEGLEKLQQIVEAKLKA